MMLKNDISLKYWYQRQTQAEWYAVWEVAFEQILDGHSLGD